MSTRCQIAVQDNENIKIYKHSDGYPDGVIPVLLRRVQSFMEHRGWDPSYLTARILMAFGVEEAIRRKEWETHEHDVFRRMAKEPCVLGFGLDTDWHGDIEFAYVVDKEFNINVHCFWGVDFEKRRPSKKTLICQISPTCTLSDALAECKRATDKYDE